jgi:nitrous oxidase accessory protein NosD
MRYLCTSIVATVVLAGTSLAATINVPADHPTIQGAVVAAEDGDEVVVAPGTYTGTGDQVVDMLGKAITLRASGTPEETIIDGEGVRRVILCSSGEDLATVIDGFTLANGRSDYDNGGAGIYCSNSSPTVSHCAIVDCASQSPPGFGGHGGGIHCREASSPAIIGCRISNNWASGDGAGIWCSTSSNAILVDTTVCGNFPDQIYGNWTDNGGNTVTDECPNDCPCDLDGNGEVGVDDLLALLAAYQTNADGDCDGDGDTDVDDLLLLISAWGACP